ncbi:hypothetical protein BASA81_015465 [Batrachochytrium salamandrivorans]|nr:hypothetical protein BASA81_015465 [Batrachochytrium salamandrivorans]
MQIRHLKSVIQSGDTTNRVTALAWSPNNQKLAVVTADRVVHLFDETGERKDRFSTKHADSRAARSYYICGLAFSPDSTKLAVAQSDCAVFVYKLGLDWGEKKSICNKFIQSSEITCLTWPREQHNALVFGLADGKVRIGNLKSNKAATLYQTNSLVVSATSAFDGNTIMTGHVDGTIYRFYFDDGVSGASQGKFTTHHCSPILLLWGESVVVIGSDNIIVFYDSEGGILQQNDFSKNDEVNEMTVAEVSPSGQSIAIGSFNCFHLFNYVAARRKWEEAPIKIIENFYTITALAWKPDGSRLVAGNMCGAVELFDCCLKRSRYKGKFEFNYVSPNQVIVKRLSTGSRIVLKSHYGYEVQKVNIFQDQFLISNTSETLLMGDLASCKLSEIPWIRSENEKFYFENPLVCMVFNAGELSLIEYGANEVLGSCRTEHMNPHLLSVRLNERCSDQDIKRVAYLIDLQTVQILDLITGLNIATISHDAKIDWLELSTRANKLLFRDKHRQLHLYDISTQSRTTLLSFCSYVQVFICLVLTIARVNPERVTMFPIKGEVEDIERVDGKTEVIVDEGVNTVSYTLDEGLIEFGTALDNRDYDRAISLLETLDMTPETDAMWKSLSVVALIDCKLVIAERCFAALGDVSRARYLASINEIADSVVSDHAESKLDYHTVRAKLAVLDKQFSAAESIYLEQGRVEEAMEMYQEIHKWDMSIRVAEANNHPELDLLKRNYFQWLVESGQEEKAGILKEEEGDMLSAISLYLKAGMPGRSASVLLKENLSTNFELTERIASSLYNTGLYEKAGNLYERLGSNERALEAYRRGKAFRAAIELCRVVFPAEVVTLEEQWGDHMVAQKQMDGAINHYIEAGKSLKAIDAAILAKQWKKAIAIAESLDPPESGTPYFLTLARHFANVPDYPVAEKYYIQAGRPQDAVDMYTRADMWEKAHVIATSYMLPEDIAVLYISQAKEMESKMKLREAEKLYLTIGEPDLAINMYKNHKQYDQMIRMVTLHHKDLLMETHLYLGKTLEAEGNLRLAEHHYIEGEDWKAVINMYCANNAYEEAYRVGKSHGGPNSSKQIAYLWARSLGGESAVKLLRKFGLLDAAIDFAAENGAFDFAFELSRYADKHKLVDVHYKHAMYLEDEGRFRDAEGAFLLAGKPREAILMYIHNENWDRALDVAESHEPSSVGEVLTGQAKVAFERGEIAKAESLVLRAQRPELAISFYKDTNNWRNAIRFAKEYLPNKLAEVHEEYDQYLAGQNGSGKDHIVNTAIEFEQQKEYSRSIDMYLKLSTAHSSDFAFLQDKWEYAVNLALKFVPDRVQKVSSQACAKLLEIKCFASAGDLFFSSGQYKEAIDAYISGDLWDKAKTILKYAPEYTAHVESAYVAHLKSSGNAESLANVDMNASLEIYSQRGEWDMCLEKASAQSSEVLFKYLLVFAAAMIRDKKYEAAATTFVKYGVPQQPENFDLYMCITQGILKGSSFTGVTVLRDFLFKLIHGTSITPHEIIAKKFGAFLLISHLGALKLYCLKKRDLNYFAAKQAISLLRYTKMIQPDRAFLEAGQASKNAGRNNMAFVCWNRFLDLSEAIEEGSLSAMENTDFINTDVPFDVELPLELVDEVKREEVRDWVLQVSLDQKISQDVDKRDCEQCGTSIYEASLECFCCQLKSEACIVTGYPVLRNSVKCTSCNKMANKDDWNKFVMIERICPWCATNQSPVYFQ